MLFRYGQLGIGLFLFLGHGRRDILQGRPYLRPPNLERSIEIRRWDIILLVLLDGRVLDGRILGFNLYIKIANAIAHDVQHLLILRPLLVLLLHDAFEAIALLQEGLGTGAFLLGHLEELGDVDGRAEELELVGLLEFGTDVVVGFVVLFVRLVDAFDHRLEIHRPIICICRQSQSMNNSTTIYNKYRVFSENVEKGKEYRVKVEKKHGKHYDNIIAYNSTQTVCYFPFSLLWLLSLVIEQSIIIQMGNQKSDINIESFHKEDWQPVEKLPQLQVWQNRKDPSMRIEQYMLFTQSEAELKHERKMFQLRRRSPLLVAAYYLEYQPSEEFCSSHSKHFLYLERIPIRLLDIQHVPFPDYLHLFDACLKGFGQLARCAGYFVVDEAMIGINQRGMAKAWLSDDFSKSRPFGGQTTQENMVRSLIDTIQRNIDSQLLPPNIPSVRNFLYKNSDALTFDLAIWQMGEYIRIFNDGRVPTRLDCIDRAGGIYTIANREQINVKEHFERNEEYYKIQNGTGFSEANAYNNINAEQKLVRHTSHPQLQRNRSQNALQQKQVRVSQQFNQPNHFVQTNIPVVNRTPIQTNIGSPRASLMAVRRSNIIQNNPTINFNAHSPKNVITSPRNIPQIIFQSPRQIRKIDNVPIPTVVPPSVPIISRSPPHKTLPIVINNHTNLSRAPPIPFNPPVQVIPQISPRAMPPQTLPRLSQSHHFPQQIVHNPVFISSPKQYAPIQSQNSKAPKFTVEVVPGKVIPQKSSTIFKQSTVSKQTSSQKDAPSLLEGHKPTIATSEKVVAQEKIVNGPQVVVNQQQKIQNLQTQKDQVIVDKQAPQQAPNIQIVTEENAVMDEQPANQEKVQIINQSQGPPQQDSRQFQKISQQEVTEQVQNPFLANVEKSFDAIQRKIVVSTSFQGQQIAVPQNSKPQQYLPIIQQNIPAPNQQQGLRQDRMSLWTAGSQQKSIDYEQMERKLAISFNPSYEELTNNQQQNTHPHYSESNDKHTQKYQMEQQNHKEQAYNYQPNIEYESSQQVQAQNNGIDIKQTGKFGYSQSPNTINEPEMQAYNEPIYKTSTFNTFHAEYQHKPQIVQFEYENKYGQNNYTSNYTNYRDFNDYGIDHKIQSKNYFTSTNYDYSAPIQSQKYSAIQESDGKSSPDFLKRLNQLTRLEVEEPKMDDYTYHHTQKQSFDQNYGSNYNDYLKKLTTQQDPFTYNSNGSYLGSHNYDGSNDYDYTGDYFKVDKYKVDYLGHE